MDNSVKMLINDYVNYDQEDSWFAPDVVIEMDGPVVDETLATALTLDMYSFNNLALRLYTPDGSTAFKFVTPSGVEQPTSGNYGSGSAVKWEYQISNPSIESGWWQVLDAATGNPVAQFDFAISFLEDSNGELILPYPLLELKKDTDGKIVGVTFHWVLKKESETVALTNPDMLETIIGKQEFYIDYDSDAGTSTFMFDRANSGQPSMSGDITEADFDRPVTRIIHVGCRFGFHRLSYDF